MHLGIDVYNVIQSTLLALTKISRVQFAMASGILLGIILHISMQCYKTLSAQRNPGYSPKWFRILSIPGLALRFVSPGTA